MITKCYGKTNYTSNNLLVLNFSYLLMHLKILRNEVLGNMEWETERKKKVQRTIKRVEIGLKLIRFLSRYRRRETDEQCGTMLNNIIRIK